MLLSSGTRRVPFDVERFGETEPPPSLDVIAGTCDHAGRLGAARVTARLLPVSRCEHRPPGRPGSTGMTGWELCSRGGLGRLKLIVPDQGDLMNGHGDLGATAVRGGWPSRRCGSPRPPTAGRSSCAGNDWTPPARWPKAEDTLPQSDRWWSHPGPRPRRAAGTGPSPTWAG
jgi:hypothetical protein